MPRSFSDSDTHIRGEKAGVRLVTGTDALPVFPCMPMAVKQLPVSFRTGKKSKFRKECIPSPSPQAACRMFAPAPAESNSIIDRVNERYIALMKSQHPQGFFDGMEIVCSQKGIDSNQLKIPASKIRAGSTEEKNRISVTLLASDLLENDPEVKKLIAGR